MPNYTKSTKQKTQETGFTLRIYSALTTQKTKERSTGGISFTVLSKSEKGVGSGVAVFTGKLLAEQLKFKLENRCSNNQAAQLAIVKALEVIEMQLVKKNEPGRAVICTDSKITLDSIKSAKNHEHLVEKIRKRPVTLNWKIKFKWVKAHAGIYGNGNADRLANEATQNHYVTYSRIAKSAIRKETRE